MIPSVRRTDPLSSYLSAQLAEKFKPTHQERILEALQSGPWSASRIADLTGLTIVQVDRRTIELQRAGKIQVVMAGGIPLMEGGCRVWRLV